MSTRGLLGFRKDGIDKVSYNHFDSYPDGLGQTVADFLVSTPPDVMDKIFGSIVLVDKAVGPTPAQIDQCIGAGYCNTTVSSQSNTDWYCLLHNLQGNLEEYKKNAIAGKETFMLDSIEFIKDSLWCEYAYIFNLDAQVLEFYVGFQTTPQRRNRYGAKRNASGYYPCKLCLEIPFECDCTPEDLVEKMCRLAEREEQKAERAMRYR